MTGDRRQRSTTWIAIRLFPLVVGPLPRGKSLVAAEPRRDKKPKNQDRAADQYIRDHPFPRKWIENIKQISHMKAIHDECDLNDQGD